MAKGKKILLVGCGKMGEALLSGWLSGGAVKSSNIVVVEPISDALTKYEVKVIADINELEGGFIPDVIFFAVKPQIMPDMLPKYREFVGSLFVSIAAGRSLAFLEENLGNNAAIVRAMPNLPALISRGVTVMVRNDNISPMQADICTELLEAVGQAHWVDDEGLMDAVTAISGSGPAYVFYFMECLTEAGIKLGLPKELAESLAYETVIGGAELAHESEHPANILREHVTSPGGTTEAALRVLMSENGMKKLLIDAALAAKNRSRELSGK